jgi:hypothetical protein
MIGLEQRYTTGSRDNSGLVARQFLEQEAEGEGTDSIVVLEKASTWRGSCADGQWKGLSIFPINYCSIHKFCLIQRGSPEALSVQQDVEEISPLSIKK